MSTSVPAFVRTIFNTFPLILLPPTPVSDHPPPRSTYHNVPAPTLPINESHMTLYYLPNHAPSLAIHVLLVLSDVPHNLRISTTEAFHTHPFIVPRDSNECITADALLQLIETFRQQQQQQQQETEESSQNSSSSSNKKSDKIEEEAWVMLASTNLGHARELGEYLDSQTWYSPITLPFELKSSSNTSYEQLQLLSKRGWDRWFSDAKVTVDALTVKLSSPSSSSSSSTSSSSPYTGDTSGKGVSMWLKAVVFAHLQILETAESFTGPHLNQMKAYIRKKTELVQFRNDMVKNLQEKSGLRLQELIG